MTDSLSQRGRIKDAQVKFSCTRLPSLAEAHQDLRLYPPSGSLLTSRGAPFMSLNQSKLNFYVSLMGALTPPKAELMMRRYLFQCFLECLPHGADPWDDKSLFCYRPISAIKTKAAVPIESTRAYTAYEKHLNILAAIPTETPRKLFDESTLAVSFPEHPNILDGVVELQAIHPLAPIPMTINIESELYKLAIETLSPERRHALHLQHWCPWASVVGNGECRCLGYSKEDPRTRLPGLLPQMVFGLEGCEKMREHIRYASTQPEFKKEREVQHAREEKARYSKHQDTMARRGVSMALLRLLAAHEMSGSVYGCAVIGVRFTRFFVLGLHRIAVEILPAEEEFIPRPRGWHFLDQAETKKGNYIPKANRTAVAPSFMSRPPPLNVLPSTAQEEPKTPTARQNRSFSATSSHEVRYGIPQLDHIPAPHVLDTPPRPSKTRLWRRRSSSNNSSSLPLLARLGNVVSRSEQPNETRAGHSTRPFPAISPRPMPQISQNVVIPEKRKRTPPEPRPKLLGENPGPLLEPDLRTSVAYNELFTNNLYNRLPWSLGEDDKDHSSSGIPKIDRVEDPDMDHIEDDLFTLISVADFDTDAAHAFSNLLFAAMVRIGQHPIPPPGAATSPSPITDYLPHEDILAALSEVSSFPMELVEPIVKHARVLGQPKWGSELDKDNDSLRRTTVRFALPDMQEYDESDNSNDFMPCSPDDTFTHYSKGVVPKVLVPPPRHQNTPTPQQAPSLYAMENALNDTVRFVPVSRGEMEALITRQLITDRSKYFETYPRKCWPQYWAKQLGRHS